MAALPFVLMIVIGGFLVHLVGPDVFKDQRYDQNFSSMLVMIFITLPFFTVILEEIVFRGVLFGLLQSMMSQVYAVIFSSLCFGFWHIFTAQSINTGSILSFEIPKIAIIAAVILATTFFGVLLTYLRIYSGSLLAPILVHWAINSTGIFFAFLAWNK
jgi:membrane protease YdiL (CAAX protease family)